MTTSDSARPDLPRVLLLDESAPRPLGDTHSGSLTKPGEVNFRDASCPLHEDPLFRGACLVRAALCIRALVVEQIVDRAHLAGETGAAAEATFTVGCGGGSPAQGDAGFLGRVDCQLIKACGKSVGRVPALRHNCATLAR